MADSVGGPKARLERLRQEIAALDDELIRLVGRRRDLVLEIGEVKARLSVPTMDPAQARMMLTVMPIMFTLLFYQFASGLVLYWLVSNVLGILQQLVINRGPAAPK